MSDSLDLNAIREDWQEFAAETHVYRRARETITALIAEVERREAQAVAIEKLHQPVEAEIEVWHDDVDQCPAPAVSRGLHGPPAECPGHIEKMLSCSECGHAYDDEQVIYRAWPCPTLRALGRVEVLEAQLERALVALRYIACPTMGYSWTEGEYVTPEAFAEKLATDTNVRLALVTCIRIAAMALHDIEGKAPGDPVGPVRVSDNTQETP